MRISIWGREFSRSDDRNTVVCVRSCMFICIIPLAPLHLSGAYPVHAWALDNTIYILFAYYIHSPVISIQISVVCIKHSVWCVCMSLCVLVAHHHSHIEINVFEIANSVFIAGPHKTTHSTMDYGLGVAIICSAPMNPPPPHINASQLRSLARRKGDSQTGCVWGGVATEFRKLI